MQPSSARWTWRSHDRRCGPNLLAWALGAACHARSRCRTRRHHATRRPPFGGAGDAVGATRSARPSRSAPLVGGGASVKFEDVYFRYGDGQQIFENLNLTFRPGERVGLVGRSGGGKSTLFALLQRFYDVPDGRILFDGQDITRVTQESLREAIGVVPQDICCSIALSWRTSVTVSRMPRMKR